MDSYHDDLCEAFIARLHRVFATPDEARNPRNLESAEEGVFWPTHRLKTEDALA